MTFSSCETDERQTKASVWCAVHSTVDQIQIDRIREGTDWWLITEMKLKEETER